MKTSYTDQQIENWRIYDRIRQLGNFNMFDPIARHLTSMSKNEWIFCMEHYSNLKQQANKKNDQLISGVNHG